VVTALVSVNAARVARHFGRTVTAIVGLVMFGLAAVVWLSAARDHSSYATTFLPALLVAGLGAGLAQAPLLGSAGALPPSRFSTGSGVLNMSRQIGGAVFVAVFVALVGGSTLPRSIAPVQRAWVLMAVAAIVGAALIAAMRLPKASGAAKRETR
jgi:fucose permease